MRFNASTWILVRNTALASLALVPMACSSAPSEGGAGGEAAGEAGEAITASFPIDPRKSIMVTDQDIVSTFKLQDVFDKLRSQANVPGLTSLQMFRQMFDSEGQAPGLGLGAHCDDHPVTAADGTVVDTLNGWPIQCPRLEAHEADATDNPFAGVDDPTPPDAAYKATVLANRFDLAPPDGSDCGEYRMIFARQSGVTNGFGRNFIIFEGRLPNPTPSAGLAGCSDVVKFWYNLSDPAKSPAVRAQALHGFYFDGLSGFQPVIHIDHYGAAGGPRSGQIRTNQFLFINIDATGATWSPREFRLTHQCPAGGGACTKLDIVPSFDKDTPAKELFNPDSTDARALDFQKNFFPSAIASLAVPDVNRYNYPVPVPSQFNAGEAQMLGTQSDLMDAFSNGHNQTFRNTIQTQLNAIKSPLTPEQIVERAQSLSCSGCHFISVGADVGLSSPFPSSLIFTQTRETTEDVGDGSLNPDGTKRQRYIISDALKNTFLPFRQDVMSAFLFGNPVLGFEQAGAWTSSQASLALVSRPATQGFSALQVTTPSSWSEITSKTFSAAGLAPIGNNVALDFFMSPNQPSGSYRGAVAVLISIPSAGIVNQWLGQVDLATLATNAFSTIKAPLPAATKTALAKGPSDVSLKLTLNVNAGSGPYVIDNVRFAN